MYKDESELQHKVERILGKKVIVLSHKGQGCANDAYYIEADDNAKYLIKIARSEPDQPEQNDLMTESAVIKYLHNVDNSLLVPRVIFVSSDPNAYGYDYIDGNMMIHAWGELSEDTRVSLCESIGEFHARIAKCLDKQTSKDLGINIDVDPDITKDEKLTLESFLSDSILPDDVKQLASQAKEVFDTTHDDAIFQFIHNDAHNENTIVLDGKLAGIIDFGDCEFGDAHVDFFYHVKRYPDYLQYFTRKYEELSGNKLSLKRIVSYAVIRDLKEISFYYKNPDKEKEERIQVKDTITTKERVAKYSELLNKIH